MAETKIVFQKYFIMVSSSSMVKLAWSFQWTYQHVHHPVKCCVAKAFTHSTLLWLLTIDVGSLS